MTLPQDALHRLDVRRERDLRLSNRLRERVALELMQRVVQRHFAGAEGATEDELALALHMPLVVFFAMVSAFSALVFFTHFALGPPIISTTRSGRYVLSSFGSRWTRSYRGAA